MNSTEPYKGLAAYKRLLKEVAPYKKTLVFAGIAMSIVALTHGATTYMIKPVFDLIFRDHRHDMIPLLSLAYPAIFLVKGIAVFFQKYLMQVVGQSVIRDLRIKLFRHILYLDQPFFHRTSTGELISRVTSDVQLVQASVTTVLTGLVQHLLTIVVLSVVIIQLDWKLAALALTVFPIAVSPLFVLGRRIRKHSKRGQEKAGDLSSKIVDSVRGVRVVQVFGMEESEGRAFRAHAFDLFHSLRRQARAAAISSPIMELIGGLGVGIVIYLGGERVVSGDISQGTFVALISSILLLYDPVKKLSNINDAVNSGVAAAERIWELIDVEPQVQDLGTVEIKDLQSELQFRNIHFAYLEEKGNVLKDLTFEVRKGQVVALVGPSGSGKSTTIDLVPRFLDPDVGQVLWDGTDLKDIKLKSLRSQIAMVDQQTVLFNGTVRENILCGGENNSEQILWSALEDADLKQTIEALPEGLDTVIGEDGVQLSGGQRQRLAIARAIVKNAPLLILDEATSSLDTASEQAVQEALNRLMIGKTTLVIAHRLSTIRNADLIVVMQHGEIVESGDFETLVEQGGLFANLVEQQSLS